jgi:hypothetical protein
MRGRLNDGGARAVAGYPAAVCFQAQAAKPNVPFGAGPTQHNQRGASNVPSVLQEET